MMFLILSAIVLAAAAQEMYVEPYEGYPEWYISSNLRHRRDVTLDHKMGDGRVYGTLGQNDNGLFGKAGYDHQIFNDDRGKLNGGVYGTRVLGPYGDSSHLGGALNWQNSNAAASLDVSRQIHGPTSLNAAAGGKWPVGKNGDFSLQGTYGRTSGMRPNYGAMGNFNYRWWWDCADLSARCAKILLIILNGCCILLSLSTFVFAVVDTRILKQYGRENASGTFAGDVIIIIACLLLIAVAALGAIGAFKEHVRMLYLYIGFLMLMVAVEVLISVYVSVQRYGLQFRVAEWLRQDFFGNHTDPEHRALWDQLQLTYECCGLNGPEDYLAVQQPVSVSCCPRAHRARTAYAQQLLYNTCISSKSYFSTGCEDELLGLLQSDADWLVGVAVTAFWFEATQMLLAMHVANKAKNNVHVYKATVRY